jgi:AraC-like DNA-binding protein
VVVYDLDTVGTGASDERWRDAFTALHGSSDAMSVPTATRGPSLVWQRSDRYALAWCGGLEQSVSRTSRHVRADARGSVELLVPLRGRASVEASGVWSDLVPGTAVIHDTDRAMQMRHGADFESLALVLPQLELAGRDRALASEGAVIDTTRGVGALVRHLVVGLHGERLHVDERSFDLSCDRLLDLAVLASVGSTDVPGVPGSALAESIRRHVRSHAHEPELDLAHVARALGWSTRHIQATLQDAGTTMRDLIRSERLLLARARLTSRGWAAASVSEIAAASGFSSHSLFSTAFRAEFGETPTTARTSRPA